ncbi:MAG: DnaJ domain-containing protein [Bacteroidota bacterium]|nr:DnaJ domain-containing protein [Bacteroidota bacterium]
MQGKDYYKILGLPPSATLKEIKAAYRRLAHQYHPDKNPPDLYSAAQFEIIKEAYEVLSNPAKKDQYLQQRWYDQSIGKKNEATVTTPVTVLKQILELDKYVSQLDVHRMDKAGLYAHLCDILSDNTIEKLNTFNDPAINSSIVDMVIRCSAPLDWSCIKPLSARLVKLNTNPASSEAITQFIHHAQRSAAWNKYRVWLLLLVVVLLCLLIYSISH